MTGLIVIHAGSLLFDPERAPNIRPGQRRSESKGERPVISISESLSQPYRLDVSEAPSGLLADRFATTHWLHVESVEGDNPDLRRVVDRRFVLDQKTNRTQ